MDHAPQTRPAWLRVLLTMCVAARCGLTSNRPCSGRPRWRRPSVSTRWRRAADCPLALRVTHVRALLGLARPEEALRLADAEVALHARRGAAGHEAMARLSRALVLGGDEASLTPWERRVADLAADGLPNKEIAAALLVTLKTVEVHSAARTPSWTSRAARAAGLARGGLRRPARPLRRGPQDWGQV